ncbi:MAG TPA: hypothetical protein VI685_27505, partial [Candidatus Angelobacter sp.]
YRTFNYAIIIRIFRNDVQRLSGRYKLSKRSKIGYSFLQHVFRPAKFILQDTANLSKDDLRYRKPEHSSACGI